MGLLEDVHSGVDTLQNWEMDIRANPSLQRDPFALPGRSNGMMKFTMVTNRIEGVGMVYEFKTVSERSQSYTGIDIVQFPPV